ncbi:MAG: flagellin [Pseudohongiella sp.]|nr:flagellin [Pseudohongiella sp.]MDO9521638.1 flagellin [Pseudohongiella sp.]MDP2127865.1 flagellin [Pseudohongiella sp.]
MAQIINTNIASLNAQRNLNSSQAGTNQALQRLSSGLRINSAKDDAAGLAISTRFESQIKGLGVAIRNAGDGVSLAQTAEGSLGSMTENLQRVRELALQASNGTNSAADREALQAEAKLLIEEIGRVSSGANFNGVKLLDGSLTTSFQVGANAGETISVSIGKLTTDTLGVSSKNGVSATGSSAALNVGDLVLNGVTVGASRASDDTSSTANAAASAISKAAAINRVSAQSGVTAVVDTNVVGGSSMTAAAATGSVTLNGTTIALDTTGSAASSRAAVVSAINAQSSLTGITAIDSGSDSLGVSLSAADGRNITLGFGGALTAANTGLAAAGTATGGVTLVANSGVSQINIAGANTANAGVASGSYTAGVSTVSTSARYADSQSAAIVTGDDNISGLAATNFGQLATAGQAATVTSNAIAAGASLDFSAGATSAALSGNVDVAAFVVGDYDFGDETVGVAADYTGSVDLDTVGGAYSFAALEFTVTLGSKSVDIVLDGAYVDADGVAAAITAQFNAEFADSILVTATAGNELVFTEVGTTDPFSGAEFTFGGADAATLGLAAGVSNQGTATTTNALSFDIIVDGNVGSPISVTLGSSYADMDAVLTDLNDNQLDGTGVVASLNADGFLTFTNSNTTGTASSILLTNISGDDAVAGAAALGIVAGSAFGAAGTDSELTISDGTTEVTIALTADYSAADGAAATALQTVLNTGLTGTNITATVSSGAGGLTVQFAETANTGSTITVTNGEGTVDGANLFFGAPSATNTGVRAYATDQNLEFTVSDGDNTAAININTSVADADALVAAINQQLTAGSVEAFASIDGNGRLNIVSSASGAGAQVTVSAANDNAEALFGLDTTAPIVASGADGLFGTDALNDGDLVINGVSIGAARAADDTASYTGAASSIKEASGVAIAAAINRASGSTGVTATVNATTVTGGASTAGTSGNSGTLSLNGIEVTLTVQSNADANRASAVSQINAVSGQTGVIAEDNGSGLTLTAADGRNIVMAFDTNGGAAAANFGLGGTNVASADFAAAAVNADDIAVTTYSTVSLSSAGTIEVSGGTNGNAALAGLGMEQGSFGGAVSGQFLTQVDISTQKGATDALAAIDNALNSVNAARADLGAVQNRFEATISNLEINSENLSAANSRIRDADFAAEAANMARFQVLQQAGISILAQANSSGEQVLSLLR